MISMLVVRYFEDSCTDSTEDVNSVVFSFGNERYKPA